VIQYPDEAGRGHWIFKNWIFYLFVYLIVYQRCEPGFSFSNSFVGRLGFTAGRHKTTDERAWKEHIKQYWMC